MKRMILELQKRVLVPNTTVFTEGLSERRKTIEKFYTSSVHLLNQPIIVPPLTIGKRWRKNKIEESMPLFRDHNNNLTEDTEHAISDLIHALESSVRPDHFAIKAKQIPDNLFELGFRILPGQTKFLHHQFFITENVMDKLTELKNLIKLTAHSVPFSSPNLFSLSRKGVGVSGLVNENLEKVLVEVLTFFNGKYGRLIILASLGISCTVWYTFVPGVFDVPPPTDIFPHSVPYERFMDVETDYEKFKKMCFIERTYVTEKVLSTYENTYPFSEINIPVSGATRVAVGLALIISVLLVTGHAPCVDII